MKEEEKRGVGFSSAQRLWTIRSFKELPSTNLKAWELARGGAPEGTVVTARGQSSGRGRRGRGWFSPPDVGLYLSVVLRPPVEPEQAAQLSLV
ncbi:MAG: biotin--[acetyl-CoA-carboxylase] ligase, partial [Nitrospinota bacterium]